MKLQTRIGRIGLKVKGRQFHRLLVLSRKAGQGVGKGGADKKFHD